MSKVFGRLRQIGYIVHDLDQAIERWLSIGIGPFFRTDHIELDSFKVGGVDMAIDLSLAFAYSGDVQIELIQQHNVEPSPYKDYLDTYGEGMHHVCFWSMDYAADFARWTEQGYKLALNGVLGGANFAYFDHPTLPGTYVEVADMVPWVDVMEHMRLAAEKWDGSGPVRDFSDLVPA